MNTKPLILIAEDDPDDQYFFQEAIEVVSPLDAETHFVWDGSKLMKYLRETLPVQSQRKMMVILDLNMQVQDGHATLNEIKADPTLMDIPVVILTTSSNEADMEYCLHHGAAAYYRKPESITELVGMVRTMLHNYLD
jgi:CheY-like chemotaxis protein